MDLTRGARFAGLCRHACALLLLVVMSGCASYASRIRDARSAFERGDYDFASEELKKLVERADNDQLLYLMDLGTVYHNAGRYQDAIQTFLKADKLAEIKDYTSISEESAAVLLSDEVKPYKGEDFEKILINVYLAIDYTLSRQYDEALVECRRVNHKLDLMISQGKLPYEQNAFAKYLAAALFEARREYNDAFVDYRQLLKWQGNDQFPYLGLALLRNAERLRAEQELAEFKKRFPDIKDYRLDKGEGEVILIVEQGKSPIKVPSPNFRLLPTFRKRYYASNHVWLRDREGKLRARTYPLFDIEATAIKELDHRIAGIAAKKIAGVVAKEAAGYAVQKATDSKLAGALTSILLHVSDQADLRSWTTLPARLQLARLTVPAGKHNFVADLGMEQATDVKGAKQWDGVEVKPGQTVFLHYRTRE